MSPVNDTRRRLLGAAGAGLITSGLSACCCGTIPRAAARAIRDPGASRLILPTGQGSSALAPAVDVHAHVFNAHDVPIVEYFTRPILHLHGPANDLVRLLVEPVAGVIRAIAPCADDEFESLGKLIAGRGAPALLDSRARDENFAEEVAAVANRTEFRERYRREQLRLGLSTRADEQISPAEILDALQDAPSMARNLSRGFSIGGVWRFFRRLASPRLENARKLIEHYGVTEDGRQRLFAVSTLDYDSSLTPRRASTQQYEKVRLMARLNVALEGRLLPFVGYDPRRDVETGGAALADVKEAIDSYGHVGIKLYPVMGFAAYGNGDLSNARCEWPEGELDYGNRLDKALDELYEFAATRDVPLIAHSSNSSGITRECQVNGRANDWTRALDRHPGLTVCAAHLGNDSDRGAISERMRDFATLMESADPRRVFGDLAFLLPAFQADDEARLREVFDVFLTNPQTRDRVIFGTDWFMITASGERGEYARQTRDFLLRYGDEALVQAVFVDNPANYLLLRKRLDPETGELSRFFRERGMSPAWTDHFGAVGPAGV